MNQIPFGQDVLILGGGQLARMLAHAGQRMGHNVSVLSDSPADPAAQVTPYHNEGNPKDADTLREVLERLKPERVTIESEFIPGGMLGSIFRSNQPLRLCPSARNITMLQYRKTQKEELRDRNIPTAPFVSVKSQSDLKKALDRFGHNFVLKACMNGYDGKGTTIVKSPSDYDRALTLDFENPLAQGHIAEQFVQFDAECALTATRNERSGTKFFPLVRTHQKNNQLDWLVGPIPHPALEALEKMIAIFLRDINFIGSITFELFDIHGELLVNEIAPRVHNSAHHTIESCNVSQFTQHWRAVLGYDLIEPVVVSPFAMVNLIGAGAKEPQAPAVSTGHTHWYGKDECKIGRKMGHVTLLGQDSGECLRLLLEERNRYVL